MVRRTFALAALLLLVSAAPALADITVFLGATTTPTNRVTKGVGVGLTLVIVGFEFEYASTSDDPKYAAPALTTGMGNALLQTPVPIFGFQPYFTVGGGVYHESLGASSDTNVAVNTGGGVKISLIGPLRLRVDYRITKLASGAMYSPVHRIYAGLNLKF